MHALWDWLKEVWGMDALWDVLTKVGVLLAVGTPILLVIRYGAAWSKRKEAEREQRRKDADEGIERMFELYRTAGSTSGARADAATHVMLALSGSEQTIAGMRFQATINAVFMAAQMVILVAARSTWSGILTGGFVFHAVIVFMTLRELKEELAWAANYRNRARDLWLEKVEGHFQRKIKAEQGPSRDSPRA